MASASASSKVYFTPTANWTSAGGERFALYMFTDNSTNAWTDFVYNSTLGVYEATFDDTYTGGMIICRMTNDGSKTDNNWDNKWNQSSDLPVPTTPVYYTMSGSPSDWNHYTFNALVPSDKTYYISGEGNNELLPNYTDTNKDEGTNLVSNGDFTYSRTIVGNPIAAGSDYGFKIYDESNNWYSDTGNSYAKWPVSGISTTDAGIYTIEYTFNYFTQVGTATATKTADATLTEKYVIAGNETLTGYNWNTSGDYNVMDVAGNTGTLVLDGIALSTGTNYEFKAVKLLCANGEKYKTIWENDPNSTCSVGETGAYGVTFTCDITTLESDVATTKRALTDKYVVAGVTTLTGYNWKVDGTVNEMAAKGDGTYTLTFAEKELAAGNYGYKVVKLGTYSGNVYTTTWIPDGIGNEKNVTIASDGTYDITINYDPEGTENDGISHTATPHLNTYTATFDNAGKWAKVYAYVFNGTAIDGVVWPGKDITETLADGKYTYSAELSQQPAYIIFNAGNGGMQTTDLEFTNGNAYTYTVPNYRICGDGIFGGWGATEGDTDVNPMVLGDDGVFTWSKNDVEIGAGDLNHAFRIQINKKYHNDDDNAAITALYTGIDGIANNMAVNLTKTGIYDFTVTFNQNTKTVTCTPTRHPVAPKAYTVKVVNSGNWDNVHAYTWRGEEPSVVKGNGEWPGGEIAKSGEKAGNFDIYTYTTAILEEDDVPEKIIFNNGDDPGVEGSTKTANLTFEDNKTYWGVTTYGLEGAVFGGWKDGSTYRGIERLFTKAGENTYTYTEMGVALEAATTQYRVSVDGAWVDDYQNTSLEVATAGTYDITVTLNTSTKTTNVTLTPVLFSIDKALNLTDFEATAHSVDGSNISYAIGTVTPGTPDDGFTLTVTPTAPATSAAFTSALVADNNYWDNYFPSATLALAGKAMSGADNFKNVTFTNVALVADQFIYYNNLKEVNLTYDAASSVTIPANCFASISSPHCAVTIDYTGSNFTVGENALEKTVAYTINVNGATAYDALLAYKTANSAAYTLNYTGTLYTATYVNTEDWTNVYAYAWQGTNTPVTAAWPGEQLTTTGTQVDGHDVYAFSNMHQPDHIIFHNNAGVQTADLAFVNEKQYSFVATDTYTVAGSSTQLFGAEWNYSEGSGNDMTKGEGTSTVYTKSYANVALSAGNIEYKVFKAYNSSTTFPAENNAILNIATMGMYNVTFTFDASTNEVSAVAERQGDIPLTYSYVLAGSTAVTGYNWDITGAHNVMTAKGDGTYTLTVEDKTLEVGDNDGFKVVKFGTYGGNVYETTWIPDGMSNNKTVAIGEKGIYTITFTYDPAPGAANDGIAYSATPTQIEVPAISATGYATYSSAYALDFTDVTAFNAYIATGLDAQKQVVMAPAQQKVPAETGLVLAAEGGCEATLVPVAALAPAIGDNLLVAHVAAGNVAASVGSEYRYVLAKKNDEVGFYKLATTLNLPANRAYLQTTEALATNSTGKVSLIFDDDETTNINALTLGRSALDPTQPMYNISGQRVGNDYKGIVIQNGKKYVNK